MNAEQAVATTEIDESIYELESLTLDKIPAHHPVGVFAARYQEMTEGHFIPDETKLLSDAVIRTTSSWLDHVEPVKLGGHVDFYVLDPGQAFSGSEEEYQDGKWMSEAVDEEFIAARYHECVTAAILRTPMYSRGAMPTHARSFIMQYRGVFPMFADNHARLRLAIMSAETFIELKY